MQCQFTSSKCTITLNDHGLTRSPTEYKNSMQYLVATGQAGSWCENVLKRGLPPSEFQFERMGHYIISSCENSWLPIHP